MWGQLVLSRMPGRLGLWLGLTGARFNGADAIGLGLADHAMGSRERVELPARLAALDWSAGDPCEQIEVLLTDLQEVPGQALPLPYCCPTRPASMRCWLAALCKGCWHASRAPSWTNRR